MDDHDVRQDRAADEQDGGQDREDDAVALLVLVQAGRDERPQLVQPDRAGQDDAGGGGDLEAEHELLERPRREQAALVAGVAQLEAGAGRDVAIGAGEDAAERRHAQEPGAVPPEAEAERHHDRGHRDEQAGPQLVDVLDERHGAVGVTWPAASLGQQATGAALTGGAGVRGPGLCHGRGGLLPLLALAAVVRGGGVGELLLTLLGGRLLVGLLRSLRVSLGRGLPLLLPLRLVLLRRLRL